MYSKVVLEFYYLIAYLGNYFIDFRSLLPHEFEEDFSFLPPLLLLSPTPVPLEEVSPCVLKTLNV